MNLSIEKLRKYISYILFIFGFLANILGLFNAIKVNNGILSITCTSLCLLCMIIIFIISLIKRKPDIFTKAITAIVGFIFFPFILLTTKSPTTFIMNMFIMPVTYAITFKSKKDAILPAANLVIDFILINHSLSTSHSLIFTIIYIYIFAVPSLFSLLLNEFSDELIKENKKVRKIAERDELTGLYNRYHLQQFFNKEQYIPIMIDIDFFKSVNDTYGHDEGDKVLQRLSSIILRNSNDNFISFRYGGEEFLIISKLSKESTNKKTLDLFNTIRNELKTSDGKTRTVSIGIGDKDILTEQSIKIADVNLYVCKNAGRNCVCHGGEIISN